MTKKWLPAGLLWAVLVAFWGHPQPTLGDGDSHGVRLDAGENKGRVSFTATIATSDQGVRIDIHGQESIPGQAAAPPASPPAAAAANSPPATGTAPASGQATAAAPAEPTIVRSWYDPVRGYFSQTSDGHIDSLEGIPIDYEAGRPGGWENMGAQQHPNSNPMAFNVDGQLQDIVWMPDQASPDTVQWGAPPTPPPNTVIPGGGGTDPHQVALDVLAHIPLPSIRIGVNPDIGLVAMPDWFWIEGYDGGPIQQSRTVTLPPPGPGLPAPSFTVTVRIWPEEYDWLFGDGGSLVAHSLGEAYPAESDLQHTYEYSSLPFASGFPVNVTVRFRAQYSVNGGAPQPLPTIQHTYEANHRVQEVQAVVNGHQPAPGGN